MLPAHQLGSLSARGWRETIFRDVTDRARFLDMLGEVCGRSGWRVHAFMPDAWIATALHLGHVNRVSHAVRAAQTNR